ncbi:MAG: bifunctional metallophosphatase/5'-nucleotidase [Flavobacteriaceae bacterium]|nr:bifunctional metallophosphatase/5'-nucleotidase [Flavobacteriaceae bacterium]
MKFQKYLLGLCIILLVSSCKKNTKINVTLLQLNDVYEISALEGGKVGGMARVKTVYNKLLKENPDTYILMAGDFLNPSLLGTLKYKGDRIRGKQIIEVMNALPVKLATFGNHEFDLKYPDLQKRLNESTFDWVSANAKHNVNDSINLFYKIQNNKKKALFETYILNINQKNKEFKIGFLSLTIDSNKKDYVNYEERITSAKRVYKGLKSQTDLVLGFTHLTKASDRELLKKFPNVPLIMGGHEHTNMFLTEGNSHIAKADANAKSVYVHRLQFDTKTKKTTIKSTLVFLDSTVAQNSQILKIVNKWNAIQEAQLKGVIKNPEAVVYDSKIPLDGRDTPIRSVQTNLGQIIAKSMFVASKKQADCAFVNGGSIRLDDVLVGEITGVDIFRVLPFGGSVYEADVKGQLLKEVLGFGQNAAGTGAYLQRYNANFENGKWLVNGKIIKADKTYHIVLSDYLMKGFDIPMLKPSNPMVLKVYKPIMTDTTDIRADIRKTVISFLKSDK